MENKVLNLYLSRILSGFYIFIYDNIKYKLIYPDITIKYEAELYAQEEYENCKYSDWINEEELIFNLINLGLWTIDGDNRLQKINQQIEDAKIDLYKNYFNTSKVKSIKRNISGLNKSYEKLYSNRHSLDHLTAYGYSQTVKNQYILINSLYYDNNIKVFSSLLDSDYTLLNSLSNIINENTINMNIFRKLARSDIWRNYWGANKNNIFDKNTVNWTDEQKTLVVLTKMYDNAYEHPECPPNNIIDDDDAFDGWLIFQKRENEKNKNKQRTEKMLGNKLNKAGEVFLMAHNKEEAQSIYNLNDPLAQNTIKERNNVILNSSSDIKENNLPDVQRNLQIQRNQLMMKRK
jgi:hypothetical protein